MRRIILAALSLGACDSPAPMANESATQTVTAPASAPAANAVMPDPAPTAKPAADYIGRWTGVEGMYLTVTPRAGGGVTLDMQWDLDHRGTFPGSVTAEGLRFTRAGQALTAVPGDGDATGLKYLAGKPDCLTVKPGEGYCR